MASNSEKYEGLDAYAFTLSNVVELLGDNKKSFVFINKSNDFITVSDESASAACAEHDVGSCSRQGRT
jgi:hypothetical protein